MAARFLQVVRISHDNDLGAALASSKAGWSGLHALAPLSDLRLLMVPELSLLDAFAVTLQSIRSFLSRLSFPTYDPDRVAPSIMLQTRAWENEVVIAYPTVPGFNYIVQSRPEFGWTDSARYFQVRIASRALTALRLG